MREILGRTPVSKVLAELRMLGSRCGLSTGINLVKLAKFKYAKSL